MIFINYRRRDAAGTTGRLYDHLETSFHPDELFMDVEDIAPGLDFVAKLEAEVRRCDVLLCVIGPNWLTMADGQGRQLLLREYDYVRLEIEVALRENKLVIPVLVDGGEVPSPQDLPPSIRALSRRSGFRIGHERFKSNVRDLIRTLREAVKDAEMARQKTEHLRIADVHKAREARAKIEAPPTIPRAPRIAPPEDTVVDPRLPSMVEDISDDDEDEGEATQVIEKYPGSEAFLSEILAEEEPPAVSAHNVPIRVREGAEADFDRVQSVPMVLLPGGQFTMGGQGHESEQPIHEALVSRFGMMIYPVTNELYASVTSISPGIGAPNAPVSSVSWLDAVMFCNRLSRAADLLPVYRLSDASGVPLAADAHPDAVARVDWMTGTNGFRLPTEAEFEFGMRAGRESEFYWGELQHPPHRFAWFGESANEPQPVGRKHPNPWGFFDMAGNVWEWCWDRHTDRHEVASEPVDRRIDHLPPNARAVLRPNEPDAERRIVRGGSYLDQVAFLRTAARHWDHPRRRQTNLGFRCVVSLSE